MMDIRTRKAIILLTICCPIWWAAVVLSAQNPQHVPPFLAQYGDFTLGEKLNGAWPAAGACKVGTGNPASPWTYGLCNGASFPVPVTYANGGTSATSLTQAQLNLMGWLFARAYVSGGGNNGIANAATASQMVVADPSYGNTEQYSFLSMIPNVPKQFHFQDLRGGTTNNFYHTWESGVNNGINFGNQGTTADMTNCLYDGTFAVGEYAHRFCRFTNFVSTEPGFSFGNSPYGPSSKLWRINQGDQVNVTSYGSGIDEVMAHVVQKYGIGDTTADYFYVGNEGGATATSDEATKAFGTLVQEDSYTFSGTCVTGCSTGSVLLKATNSTLAGQGCTGNVVGADCAMGTGRYLIDKTHGSISTTGTSFTSGLGHATAFSVSATLPVSNAWGTQNANCGPADAVGTPPFSASSTCSITLTSGTFDTSHLVCFASQFHDCAVPTAVGSPSGGVQSITLPLRAPHAAGGYVFQGGMAGYGLELSAFNESFWSGTTLRYLFDVIGSTDSHTVQAQTWLVGNEQPMTNFPDVNAQNLFGNFPVTNLTNSGTTVSGTSGSGVIAQPYIYTGSTFVISGASDSAFNTSCTGFTWSSPSSLTCTIAGLSGSHTAASATASNNASGVVLWPMAQVIDVQNEALTPPKIDGTFALEPNIIPFAASDVLEETHALAGRFQSQTNAVFASNPYNNFQQMNVAMEGPAAQGGCNSFTCNALATFFVGSPPNFNTGNGGWHMPPNMLSFGGPYDFGLNFERGPAVSQSAWAYILHSSAQKSDPNYFYNLFHLVGRTGDCRIQYAPYTNALTFKECSNFSFGNNVDLPAITLQSTSGFASGQGYNYAPYSNTLTAATWQNTGAGTGSVTCAITDDQGNPACTVTGNNNFNWQDNNTGGYTPMPANTLFTVRARMKGAAGGELVDLGGDNSVNKFTLTTQWQDYCTTFTTPPSGSDLFKFAAVNMTPLAGSQTVYVSNVVSRPGPACGPTLITQNSQFTTLTNVNYSPSFNSLAYSLNGNAEGAANGLPGPLDGSGKIPVGQLPSIGILICSGTIALSTGAITLGSSVDNTATCTGLLTTDNILVDFNSDPTGVTGYSPAGNLLTISKYPAANTIHVKQSNNAGNSGSITPGAITVNYHVYR